MSGDLTAQIERIIVEYLAPAGVLLPCYTHAARAIAALIAEREADARRKALEEAALDIDCGCECRPMVMMALADGHPRAERHGQSVCTSLPGNCLAVAAASIRALAEKENTAVQEASDAE